MVPACVQVAALEAKLAEVAGHRNAAEQQVGFSALCGCRDYVITSRYLLHRHLNFCAAGQPERGKKCV